MIEPSDTAGGSPADLITSAANPLIKRFRALGERKHRRREQAFVVEGLQPVWRAVTAGWPVEALLVAPELLTQDAARQMVGTCEQAGVRVAAVSRALFERLSERDGPAGLAAIVGGAVPELSAARFGAGPVVALHRPGNPGNVGTMLRTADATGAGGLIVIGAGTDPLAPAAVKASMGSVFAVPLAHAAEPDAVFAWAEAAGRPVLAITGAGATELWRTELARNAVLLFGSEGDGLPDDLTARCATAVAIPMLGTAESLNLATAASVVLYESLRRQRS